MNIIFCVFDKHARVHSCLGTCALMDNFVSFWGDMSSHSVSPGLLAHELPETLLLQTSGLQTYAVYTQCFFGVFGRVVCF